MINAVNSELATKQARERQNLATTQAAEMADLATQRTQLLQDQPVERQNQRIAQKQERAAQQEDFRFHVRPKDVENQELAALKQRQAADVQKLVARQAQDLASIDLQIQNLKKRQVEAFKVLMNAQQMERDEVDLMNEHDLDGTPMKYLSTGRLITPAVAQAMREADHATGAAVSAQATVIISTTQPQKNNLTDSQLWDAKLTLQFSGPLQDVHDLGLDTALPRVAPIGVAAWPNTSVSGLAGGYTPGSNPAMSNGANGAGGSGQGNGGPFGGTGTGTQGGASGLGGGGSLGGQSNGAGSGNSNNNNNNANTLGNRFAVVGQNVDPSDLARIGALEPGMPAAFSRIDYDLNYWANKPVQAGAVLVPPIISDDPPCDCCLKAIPPDAMPPIARPGGCHCPNCTQGLTYADFSNAAGGPVTNFTRR